MTTAHTWSGSRWRRDCAKDVCYRPCLSTYYSPRYFSLCCNASMRTRISSPTLSTYLQKRHARIDPETALKCVRRALWGMLYVVDTCFVSRSSRDLKPMMIILNNNSFDLTASDKITETTYVPTPHTLITPTTVPPNHLVRLLWRASTMKVQAFPSRLTNGFAWDGWASTCTGGTRTTVRRQA